MIPTPPRPPLVPAATLLLFAALALPGSARATPDSTAALARARALRPAVSAGDAATLWRAMSPVMRERMKDSTTFAARTAAIAGQTGAIDSVLSEEVARENGLWHVRTRCRFVNLPIVSVLALAFDDEDRLAGISVRPDTAPAEAPSPHLDYRTKTPLRLPFEGEWQVIWGGRTIAQNQHAASRAQRFAHDLVIRKDGSSHSGDGTKLTDYHCYGAPVLAPADGVVVWAEDHHPDQTIGASDREHPIGNGVVIDHGNGEFSLLAHLQPRSVAVRAGDRVTAGQRLGRCGNSGNTSEPHLHYHLQNGPEMANAEGLPAVFRDLVVDDRPVASAEIVRHQRVRPAR